VADGSTPKRGRPKEVSRTDSELLATGEGTMAQIAKLFRRDAKTMPRLLHGLVPTGVRRGSRVYSIEEAATRLVKPGYSIETYIKRMHQSDLPPLVAKEFWNGQRARQAYEENEGDLWRTPDIVEALAEAFATCRTSLLLLSDAIARESVLSTRQQELLKRLVDGAISDLKKSLVERFANYEPPVGIGHNSGSFDPFFDGEPDGDSFAEGDGEEEIGEADEAGDDLDDLDLSDL
jgi:hypothetical protein